MFKLLRTGFIFLLSVAVAASAATVAQADSRMTYIVMPKEGSAATVRGAIESLGEYPEDQLTLVDNIFIVDLLPADAASLAQNPAVSLVEEDSPVVTAADQNPAASWGLDRIDGTLDGTYSFPNQSGEGVVAYVFDTGVAANHPDLAGRVSQGFDVIGNNQANTDCHYHGTHVAGTIAGSEFGVAKKASIVPLRVLNCAGSGSTTGVIRAINWTIANHPAGTPAVANFSLGGGRSIAFNTAIASLVDSGIVTVVAAGNERTDACTRSPASSIEAITVGATDRFDNRASFSNFGDCVDLFAPGLGILSADARNFSRPVALSGTSMASPHVAGVAALILGQSPSAIPEQVEAALFRLSQPGVVNNSQTVRGNRLANIPTPAWTPLPTIPGAPTGLTPDSTGRGFAEFRWDEVPDASGYQVEYRRGGENAFTLAPAATNKFRVIGLSGGEMAYLRVRAIVSGIATKFSTTIGARSAVEVSSAPRDLRLEATSKTGMVMTWAPPGYLGGASSLTYRVEMRTTGEWAAISSGPSSNLRISSMNAPHQFRVFAINEAGVSAASEEVTFDPLQVVTVQTVSAAIEAGSNVNVSWRSDATNSASFEVVLSRTSGTPAPVTVTVQGNQYRFTGLTRMTGYRISVTPVGKIRGLQGQVSFATAAVVPGAPTIVSNARQEASWLLAFAAPADNGGVPITSYRLERLLSGTWSEAQTSSGTVFSVPLPARGTFQDFRLVAVNSLGDSLPSNTIRISTPAVRPSSPQAFTAELAADGKVQMSWSPSVDDGGSAIQSYRVEILRNGIWSLALSQLGTTSSALIAPKGATVSYRVVAVNSVGPSTASDAVTIFRSATVPDAVRNFTANLSGGLIRLNWNAPIDDGGASFAGYRVEQKSGLDWLVIADALTSSSLSIPVGLPGQQMTFRVFAANSIGASASSPERTVIVPFQQASAPEEFSVALEAGGVRLNWASPLSLGGSTVSRYVLSMSVEGGVWRSVSSFAPSQRTALFNPSVPGKTISLRLNAETLGAGVGQFTREIVLSIPATVPADPASLTGQMRPGSGVQLNWTAPLNDGGSPILEYRVELSSPSGWIVLTRTNQLSFLAPLGLPGQTLLHRVVAVNAMGSSLGARSFSTQMGTAPATPPQSLSAVISGSSVVLAWSAPAVMGGVFSRYEIHHLENGVFSRLTSTTGLSAVLRALTPGQTGTYRVLAVTNAGAGAFSSVELTAPKIAPGAPTVLSIRSLGRVNTVTWRVGSSSTGGGTLDKARLYRDDSGQWTLVAQANANAGSLEFENQLFGQRQRYVLRFTNEVGESANSSVLTLTHAVVTAERATGLSLTQQAGSLILNWVNPSFFGGATPTAVEVQSSADGINWARFTTARFVSSAQVALPAKGKSVSYRVVVINAAGRSAASDAVTFSNPLTAPVGLLGVSTRKAAVDKVTFTVTAPTDFGGYSELVLRIERQGSLAWLSSDEVKLTRPGGVVTVTLSVPVTRATYSFRVVVSNGSGELERVVSYAH